VPLFAAQINSALYESCASNLQERYLVFWCSKETKSFVESDMYSYIPSRD
jgi:hypothetical protein